MISLSPLLQAFLAVTSHKTVHAAAGAIHITQTAVTQRIHNLESRLRTTLFIRTRRGMTLTPEGEALLRYCQTVQEMEGDALAKIKGVGIETDIRVCITGPTSLIRSRVIPQCLPVLKKFPKLLMYFDVNDVENRINSLRSGETQFAIMQTEHVMPEMEYKVLKPERYIMVSSKAWKKRKLRDIIQSERIIDFDPTDQLTFKYLKHFNLLKLARYDRHFVNRTDSLALMIAEGFGYGILTIEFAKPYIDQGQLISLNNGKIYENIMNLTWYKRPEPPQYFSALIQAII